MAANLPVAQHLKNITIVFDTSRVVRMTPQLGASLVILTLMTLEVSFMLLELGSG